MKIIIGYLALLLLSDPVWPTSDAMFDDLRLLVIDINNELHERPSVRKRKTKDEKRKTKDENDTNLTFFRKASPPSVTEDTKTFCN